MQNDVCNSIDFFIKIVKLKEIKTIMQMNDIERSKILCRLNTYFGNIGSIAAIAFLCKFSFSYLYFGIKLLFFKITLSVATNIFACIANFGTAIVVPITTAIFAFSTVLSMTVSIHMMDDNKEKKSEIGSAAEPKNETIKKNERIWSLK